MRVSFIVQDLTASGGLAVVLDHARRLGEHGIEAHVVLARDGTAIDGVPPGVSVLDRATALGMRHDVAIATWWETAELLFELPARRRALMLQGLDRLYYRDDAPFEQLAASLPMFLPVHYISVSEWLCRALRTLQPGASCRVVRTGISKTVFKAREPSADGPLRVLVEGQPGIWFKGVQDAVAAARAMREPVVVTLAALDRDDPLVAELPIDRVVGGLGSEAMASAYEEADVLLKLSRFEGLSMPPLEAFHCGIPAMVTPFGGHEDYVRHGENGIVVGFDDLPGTTGWLDRLAADRGLLGRLSAGALATAAGWPDEHASTRRLAEVLRDIAEAAPLDDADALAPLVREVRLRTELGRQRVDDLEMRLDIGWGRAYDLSRRRAVRVALAASRWFGRE